MTEHYEKISEVLAGIYKDLPCELTDDELEKLKAINREFIAGFRMLVNQGDLATVFGSSRATPESEVYRIGQELGGALVRAGFAVLTGGGPGCMEAVNKGASQAKGKSMGVNIYIPMEQEPNRYAIPSLTLDHFFVRKVLLLKYSKAYIFLPGGFGTLDELFETLTLIQTGKVKPFPVVLIGKDFWTGITDWIEKKLKKENMVSADDIQHLRIADSAKEAVRLIKQNGLKE